ncbi:MAG TPA: bifunctional 2-polyprenyl-6-hydroxyphenol methylase/3-demethylubiquinol 3-O-methyltransferase UbiG [Nocardioidaceae bacterium]|nr:bifunctional 2-polyprenyl-6-hydroxyphenol methylase/3-demethylubiquinol 3-O-methyltransferase UbiG [Nocardioidaceae bacterium]
MSRRQRQIDNDVYNRLAGEWWADDSLLAMLRMFVNPGRVPYYERVLLARLGLDPRRTPLLDIGCGGGLIAEEFARMGFPVSGLDLSSGSIATAREHAQAQGYQIDYTVGGAESLPYDDGSFGVVTCCDVIEHVTDVDRVLSEASRVLRPGGVFLYDTPNRTWISKLTTIKVAQDWAPVACFPPDLHVWSMYWKPRELAAALRRNGLRSADVRGLRPRRPLRMLWSARQLKTGRIDVREFGRRHAFRESRDRSGQYMGYAVKRVA